jgi:hypothetical protein
MATNYVPKRKTIEDLNFVQKKKKSDKVLKQNEKKKGKINREK